jgi:hypothetical protein
MTVGAPASGSLVIHAGLSARPLMLCIFGRRLERRWFGADVLLELGDLGLEAHDLLIRGGGNNPGLVLLHALAFVVAEEHQMLRAERLAILGDTSLLALGFLHFNVIAELGVRHDSVGFEQKGEEIVGSLPPRAEAFH